MAINIKLDINQLRQYKIMIATPMYGGMCAGSYTRSLLDLQDNFTKMGLKVDYHFLFNESLITRARNYCCDVFLRSDCTHLMFIDSDIQFKFQDVLILLHFMVNNPEYDIIGGPYPKKCISWEKIKLAVDKGIADEDPNVLANYVGDYVFNLKKNGPSTFNIEEVVEVAEIGTGFMMLTKDILKRYAEQYPELRYKPDHVRSEDFDGSREIHAFFDTVIDPETKRYLSEDYMFCYNVAKMGGKVMFCPWMQLAHVGTYVFGGSLRHLASIGAGLTASRDLKKNKKKQK